jgi:hypothetical protein
MVFGIRIGDHVGDLEHVRILVNAGTERIDRVYFGGHSGGYWKTSTNVVVEDRSRFTRREVLMPTITAPVRNGGYPRFKDVTSDEGVAWKPTIFVQAPVTEGNIAKKNTRFPEPEVVEQSSGS